MHKQKSFNYKFTNEISEQNFFVNKTNSYAFNGLIHNHNQFSFLYGPRKSGKSFLSQIWLKKNYAVQLNDNFENLLKNKRNILIDDLLYFNEEDIFHIVDNCILNNIKLLITSNNKINEIEFKFKDLSSRLKNFFKP